MRPSLPARLRRHLGWPLALLLGSVGVAALAAVQAQRAARAQARTAERLLHDYAAMAAWSYGQRAEAALRDAAWQVLNPILHREPHPIGLGGYPNAGSLAAYRDSAEAWCRCDPGFRPALYLAFTLGDAASADARPEPGAALDAPLARRLLDSLTRHARDPAQPRDRGGLVALPHAGGAVLAAYGLMPTEWRDTIVYAFAFDGASLEAGLADVLARGDLLPGAVTRGVPNAELLAVRVRTPGGLGLHASPAYPAADWPYRADTRLQPLMGALVVQATLRPDVAPSLVDGGLPRSRLPLLVALLALAAALALVAVRQLRREQELARLRADFVASVSHELRTPLAQMRLFLETLRLGRWRTPEQRDWLLGHADREAVRLAHLVENVLAFARLGRGAPVAAGGAAPADVGAEAAEAVRAFAPLAEARGATVRLLAAAGLHARLERAGFRQLLLNLLDNAVKYGPPGQTVTVRVAPHDDGTVRLLVDDEGPGVPAAERARVWEPFARGAGDAVRATGGSGIGLAIVREVVGTLGGRAWLDTAPGGGLRVVVALPAAAPDAAPEPTPDVASDLVPDAAPAGRARPAEVA